MRSVSILGGLMIVAGGWVGAGGGEPARTVAFSGHRWIVKAGEGRGPGPNAWSGGTDAVRVDADGHLHLALTRKGNDWRCAEVELPGSLGYGVYRWEIAGKLSELDPRSILGLFLYEDDGRELDFELSRWGEPKAVDGQFVAQPVGPATVHRFDTRGAGRMTVTIDWSESAVRYRCEAGGDPAAPPIGEWTYRGPRNFRPGRERVHLNLWLLQGKPPTRTEPQEVTIRSFSFRPPATPGSARSPVSAAP